jgi:predicted ATPase
MINKIEVKGYKSIKTLELELKPLNILIGSNGVGKSNFINFFKLVNTIYEQRLQNFSLTKGADSILSFGRKNTPVLDGYLEFNATNAYGFVLNSTQDNKLFVHAEYTYFHRYHYGSGWKETLLTADTSEAIIKNSSLAISKHVNDYLKSFRIYHFHDTSDNAPLRSPSLVDDNKYLKENGSNLASYLYFLKLKHPKSYNRIEKTIESIVPSFERFELEPNRLQSKFITLEWIEKTNSEVYFNASHLSDGSLRFIALVTLLQQPTLPHTIIIDEPELGLHPVAINRLTGLIKSAAERNCQIIISTQSINLVNNFLPEDIITVDRKDGSSIFNRLVSTELTEWLEDYSVGELWSKSIIKGQP